MMAAPALHDQFAGHGGERRAAEHSVEGAERAAGLGADFDFPAAGESRVKLGVDVEVVQFLGRGREFDGLDNGLGDGASRLMLAAAYQNRKDNPARNPFPRLACGKPAGGLHSQKCGTR